MTDSAVQHTRSLLPRVGAFLLGLALVVTLSACGDDSGMDAPMVEQQIPDQSATAMADPEPVEVADLNNVFSGENLSFQAMSSENGVASASVNGGTLTITPQNGGTATITVTATNDAGEAPTSFGATINLPEAPGAP